MKMSDNKFVMIFILVLLIPALIIAIFAFFYDP